MRKYILYSKIKKQLRTISKNLLNNLYPDIKKIYNKTKNSLYGFNFLKSQNKVELVQHNLNENRKQVI